MVVWRLADVLYTCVLNVKWWSIVTPKILTVSVSGTTQPATFTPVSGGIDALACCDVDRSTASDFSGLTTMPFWLNHRCTVDRQFCNLSTHMFMSDFDNAMYNCVLSAIGGQTRQTVLLCWLYWTYVGDEEQRAQYGPLRYSAWTAGSSALFRADTDKWRAVGEVGRYPFAGNASHAKTVFKSRQ